MSGKPKRDYTQLFQDYQDWRGKDLGSDGDFLMKLHPETPVPTFRRQLLVWRNRAAQGVHPITNQKDAGAERIYSSIAKVYKDRYGMDKPILSRMTDELGSGEAQKMPLAHLIPEAQKVYSRSLSGGKVGVEQRKTAKEILEAHGLLGKKEIKTSSSFTAWSTEMLKEFLAAVQTETLDSRKNIGSTLAFPAMAEPEQYDDPARDDLQPGMNTNPTVENK